MLDRSRLLEDIHVEIPVMLWREYLRDQAAREGGAHASPVAMIAERGLYQIRLNSQNQATLEVSLRLHIFRPGQCRNLPVLSAERAWQSVTVNGRETPLGLADGWLRFSPTQTGLYEITARSPLPDAGAARENVVKLLTPRTARTLVGFDSPDVWEVTVAGATRQLIGQADQGTHGQLPLAGRDSLEVRYGPARIERERPAQYRLNGHLAWNLDTGRQQVAAQIRIRILGGRTDRLVLSLPGGAERVVISGPDVREARVRGREAVVFLRGRIAEQTSLRLQYDLPSGEEAIKRFRPPTIRDGSWSGGTLTVTHTLGGSELLAEAVDGLEDADLSQIPPEAAALLAGPPAMTYRITGRDFRASVDVLDLGEFALRESLVDLAHYELSLMPSGALICRARYEIRNRTRQFLRLTLPHGATVLLATVNEKPCPVTPAAHGGSPTDDDYLLPLVRSKASIKGLVSFPVEVVYVYHASALQERGELALPLPRLDLPIAYAWCELYAAARMELDDWAGPLRPVDRYSNETAVAQLGYGRGQLAEGFAEDARMTPGEGLDESQHPHEARIVGEQPVTEEASAAVRPIVGYAAIEEQDRDLAGNYWRAGKDYYDRGEYEHAAKAFDRVIELAPKSVEADNAARLQSNIDLLLGDLALEERSERIAGAKVRRKVAEENRKLLEQQQGYLEESGRAAREGRYQEAERKYEAAESISHELLARGEDAERQSAMLSRSKAKIAVAQQQLQVQARRLRERYESFRSGGDYEAAQQALDKLRKLGEDDDARLSREMEELVVLRAQHRAAEIAEAKHARKALPARPPAAGDELLTPAGAGVTSLGYGRGGSAQFYTERGEPTGLEPERNERIATLKGRARALIAEQRYEQALEAVREILALAPQDPFAASQMDLLDKFAALQQQRDMVRADIRNSRVSRDGLVTYPRRAETLTRRYRESSSQIEAIASEGERPADLGRQRRAGQLDSTVTQVYDVRDLLAPRTDDAEDMSRAEMSESLTSILQDNVDPISWGSGEASISGGRGRLVIAQTPENQKEIRSLLGQLRQARGPQVQRGGENIARQLAAGISDSRQSQPLAGPAGADLGPTSDEKEAFGEFISRNYAWGITNGDGEAAAATITGRAGLNLGQKVGVSSVNIAVPAGAAQDLGIEFSEGRNHVRYAVVDEAQVRTLRQIANEQRAIGIADNPRNQETIVGTDALLSNDMALNVAYAHDRGNRFDLLDNAVHLPHEDYILIDNDGFLTAAKSGPMQHWAEPMAFEPLAEVPQTIDVPRVGQLVKLEKTLVDPADRLEIRATYRLASRP